MTDHVRTGSILPTVDNTDAVVDWNVVESGPVVAQRFRVKRTDCPNSSFSDSSWSLLPMGAKRGALRNLHWVPGPKKQEYSVPPHLVASFKRVVWLMINKPAPDVYLAGRNGRRWIAPSSIGTRFAAFRHYADFLGEQGVERLSDVSQDLLDTYATFLLSSVTRASQSAAAQRLGYVGCIAFLADYLPEEDRMIEPSWWDKNRGGGRKGADNSKEIIHPNTFAPLLWWAQQLLSCAGDIAIATRWRNEALALPAPAEGSAAGFNAVARIVESRSGRLPEGEISGYVAAQYLIALNGGGINIRDFSTWRRRSHGSFTVDADLPQPIPLPVNASIEGQQWLPHIDFREVSRLQRILQAAAAIMICACTGMRGEECLRLPRGALRIVPRPDGANSYRIDGRIFKAVRDDEDQQDPNGKQWIWATIKPGADAIAAVETVGDVAGATALFQHVDSRGTEGVTTSAMTRWIQEFIDFANLLVHQVGISRAHRIAPDPAGSVTLDRFRRSIAWHIVNQPEGLLAAGVQFGHMQSTTTDGYASTITSGIGATMDQERTKALYSALQDNANAAKNGMTASGPAVKRLGEVLTRFAGAGFPGTYAELSKKDERRLRSDPDLAVRENPGHGCLCLANPLKPETMACSKENDGEPNRNDCKTYCGNRVYTDQTVSGDKLEVTQLRDRIAEVNPILAARIAKRISHLEQHIADHERDGLPLIEIMKKPDASVVQQGENRKAENPDA